MWNAQVTSFVRAATTSLLLASANIAPVSGSDDRKELLQVGRYSVLVQPHNAVASYPAGLSGSDLTMEAIGNDNVSGDDPRPVGLVLDEVKAESEAAVTACSTYGPVTSGETLSEIAKRIYPDSTFSMPRLLFALFYRNPDAFTDKNINQLNKGVLLHVPTDEELDRVDPQNALTEYRRHYGLWRQRMDEGT